jgi:hypothetical protein
MAQLGDYNQGIFKMQSHFLFTLANTGFSGIVGVEVQGCRSRHRNAENEHLPLIVFVYNNIPMG